MKTKDTQSTILSISTFLIIISKRIYLGTEGGVFERGRMTETTGCGKTLAHKRWPKKTQTSPVQHNPKASETFLTYGKMPRSKTTP